MKLSRGRDTRLRIKQLKGGAKVVKLIKNWPLYFKDFFGYYKNKDLIYKLRDGTKLLVKSDSFERNIINEVYIYGEYTPKGFEIKNEDIVMDIGANCGIFTVYAALKAKGGKVFAFEPVKKNFDRLMKNVKLNNLHNVFASELAISDKAGNKDILLSDINDGGHSFFALGGEKRTKYAIKTVSLKEIFSKNKIDRLDFLKCDCEGAEYEILFPAKELLKKINKMSMEVHYVDEKRNVRVLKDFLEENGFAVSVVPGVEIQDRLNILYAKKINP